MKHEGRIAAIAVAMALAFASPALAEKELRISTSAPGNSPIVGAMELIKERMETAFPGEIKVSVHHSNSLFKQGTEVPALMRGNLEMSTAATFEFEQLLPEYSVLGAAYVFRDVDHMVDTFRGDIGEQFRKDVADKMGLVILDTSYVGTRTVSLRQERPISAPTDFAGVKLRMLPGQAFQGFATALGATPVSMPITELYLALRTGAVDGQDNPTNLTRDWKLHEQSKQVILTRHLVQPLFYTVAAPFYDGLSAEQQDVLRAAAREAADAQIAAVLADEASALDTFREAGLTITEIDPVAFKAAVMAEYEKNGTAGNWMPGLAERIADVK